MPLTMAPVVMPPARTRLWASIMGEALITPGTVLIRSSACSRFGSFRIWPWTYIWLLNDSIRSSKVERNPAMMLITTIRAMTARAMAT